MMLNCARFPLALPTNTQNLVYDAVRVMFHSTVKQTPATLKQFSLLLCLIMNFDQKSYRFQLSEKTSLSQTMSRTLSLRREFIARKS